MKTATTVTHTFYSWFDIKSVAMTPTHSKTFNIHTLLVRVLIELSIANVKVFTNCNFSFINFFKFVFIIIIMVVVY